MGLDRLGVEDAFADALDVVVGEAVEVHGAAGDLAAEDQQVDVADQRLCLVRVVLGGALDRSHPADRGADLGVAGHRCLDRHRLPARGQRRPWLLDQLVVLLAVAPPASVDVGLGRLPRREHVVLRMPMEIDQTGEDHPPGRDRQLDITWLGRTDRDDLAALDHHPSPGERAVALQHGPPERHRFRGSAARAKRRHTRCGAGVEREISDPRHGRAGWAPHSPGHTLRIRLVERVPTCHHHHPRARRRPFSILATDVGSNPWPSRATPPTDRPGLAQVTARGRGLRWRGFEGADVAVDQDGEVLVVRHANSSHQMDPSTQSDANPGP